MKVLVVGAGAVGTPLGYILSKGGANQVSFLVRGSKVKDLQDKEIKLFNYDSQRVFVFNSFGVLSTEQVAKHAESAQSGNPGNGNDQTQSFAFDAIFVTFPANLLDSDSGRKIMKDLNVVSPKAVFVVLCPGFQMEQNVFKQAGVGTDRIVYGLPLFISHEVPMEGQPESKKYVKREQAEFAFHYLVTSGRVLLLSNTNFMFRNKPLKLVAKVVHKAGVKYIGIGQKMLEVSTASILILNLLLYLQDYPRSLKISGKGYREGVKALHQLSHHYAASGLIFRLFVGNHMMKIVDAGNRWSSKPLTITFLKHLHGSKVLQQNVGTIEKYIQFGKERATKVDHIEKFVAICREAAQNH